MFGWIVVLLLFYYWRDMLGKIRVGFVVGRLCCYYWFGWLYVIGRNGINWKYCMVVVEIYIGVGK